ncbi:MAG: radical SAM protein [Syntrophaceae bacterium]
MITDFFSLFGLYLQRRILGRRAPLLASVKLTYKCNLACCMCPFHLRSAEDNSSIRWETAVNVLDELKSMGARIAVLEGGEPLLWRDGPRDIADLVRYAKGRFLRVAATTNGTLPLDLPVDLLWVSLDGPREDHDRFRSGSFDRVWANLAKSRHPNLYVHFTMHRENWKGLEGLAVKLRKIPAVKGITVQLFYPYGQGEGDLALAGEERRAALENVLALKRKGVPVLNSSSRLRAMIQNTWTCHEDLLVNVDPDGAITRGCYARNRGNVNCGDCGFTPVAEASGALDLVPGSLLAGYRIFLRG